jgi:hypothetical protein
MLTTLTFLNAPRVGRIDSVLGRIPLLIDNTQTPPFTVMESSAELIYLQDTLDKDNVFGFDNKVEQSEAVQWLIFWQASQPIQGNLNYFSRGTPEKIPCELGDSPFSDRSQHTLLPDTSQSFKSLF